MHSSVEKPLSIAISASSRDPMYRQITEQMTHAIARGSLVPGTRIPSIKEMARELAVSEITIKRAYGDLERDGYIVTRAGLGSFVAGLDAKGLRARRMEEMRVEIERIITGARRSGISPKEIGRLVREVIQGSTKGDSARQGGAR